MLPADPSFVVGCRASVYEALHGGFGTAGPESPREDLTEPLAFARLMEELLTEDSPERERIHAAG